MRILGIDPGLNCTGYAVLDCRAKKVRLPAKIASGIVLIEAGIIRTSAKQNLAVRLKKIYSGLMELCKTYNPEVLSLEDLYSHYRNPQTAILMAHARGVIALVAAQMNMKLFNYSAKKVKKSVTGSGNARKMQVQKVIKEILRLKEEPNPNDVADAIALAITHINIYGNKL